MSEPQLSNTDIKPTTPKTAEDILDSFKDLDTKDEPKEPKKEAKEEPEEELELKEPEENLEKLDLKENKEDKEEIEERDKDEDLNIDAPPRKKEILAKYPNIFKEFPFMEKMMYRDKQYTELFGSFDDAKELAEKAEVFNGFEQQLLSGNTEDILREVKNSDEKAFNIIVDDYLQTLAKVDKDAYFHVVGNLNKRLILEMVEEAKNSDNDDLRQAAAIVHQFIFGNTKFSPPSRRVENRDEEKTSEVEKERLEFVRERFETSRDDLQSQVDNTLRATITEYIDPKGAMSSYVKKNAIADAMKILNESIAGDTETTKNLDRLWRQAFETKFSKDSLGKIKSYYLSKAKGSLKNAILKARAEALKDTSPKREKEEEEEPEEEKTSRRSLGTGRPSQPKGKNEMRKGESVTDFFMRD